MGEHCHAALSVEPVVTTTYRLVCPVHGVYAHGLSLKEAHAETSCLMPTPACCRTQFDEGAGHDRNCPWWRQQEPAHPEQAAGRGVR